MFSGIVETVVQVLNAESFSGVLRLTVEKPKQFNDIKSGDSISTNGICLTVETFDDQTIQFALAAETLQVLGMDANKPEAWLGQSLNLERSLRFGDRIHGHLVTGHVDSMGEICTKKYEGESLFLDIQVKDSVMPYVWKKGSITINGTSLTVNSVNGHLIQVCLIPETQKRTNLGILNVNDKVTIEPDYFAKALAKQIEVSQSQSVTQRGFNS